MREDLQKQVTKQNNLASTATVNDTKLLALIVQNNELQQECDNLRNLKVIKQSLSDNFNRIVALTADEKTVKIIQLQCENEQLRMSVYAVINGHGADEILRLHDENKQLKIKSGGF